MADKKNVSSLKGFSPFTSRFNASKQGDFDKYYIERTIKTIFKSTGQSDEEGNLLGVAEDIVIDKKIDIEEFLQAQADSVGVDAYIRALTLQGDTLDDYHTEVSDNVADFSNCPDNLADTMLIGDRAKAAFDNLDPALKGGHSTIEGFLNSLSKDVIDNYIAGKLEALTPAKKEGE